ncbi:MAG: PRC-barrel domain-containing protein [Methanobacterium sp.]|uniref:PRC-barrel domain-containing protein n=1 Tax=Methanobacterium sp. TaxID=2164 RepID=UPI003C738B26
MDVLINYHKDMQGKEVVDNFGNVLGKVNNISWDKSTNEIKFFEIGTGGLMEMLGRGEKKILPYDIIETIGDKILIKPGNTEFTKEDIPNIKNVAVVNDTSKVKDVPEVENNSQVKNRSIVTHTSRIKDISKQNISKIKDFSKKKETKNIEKTDDNLNIDDIEDTLEEFRIRNSF